MSIKAKMKAAVDTAFDAAGDLLVSAIYTEPASGGSVDPITEQMSGGVPAVDHELHRVIKEEKVRELGGQRVIEIWLTLYQDDLAIKPDAAHTISIRSTQYNITEIVDVQGVLWSLLVKAAG